MNNKFLLLAISILIIAMSGCVDNKSGQVSTQTPSEPIKAATDVPTIVATEKQEGLNINNISENVSKGEEILPEDVNGSADFVQEDVNESANVEDTTVAKVYSVGQSVSDGNTKMTLNNIRYTGTIDKSGNVSKAEQGNKFLILSITIENVGQDTNLSYDGNMFIILDTDEASERSYGEDTLSSEGWVKHFNGTNIQPGNVRQGELAFQVPENANGLQLRFEYYSESSEGTGLEFFTLSK